MSTPKLFHSVVVLGMAMGAGAVFACSSDDTTPSQTASSSGSTSSGSTSSGSTSSGGVDSGKADAAKDAFAGWFCCG